ncbi:hypothetical protein DY000_02040785 [Brassica cretica]|uniref:Uncharacterized protein n=1 Tax=Brassica cretica TaxID=69181 RepID=A0ABQ7BPU2_BRACR|nr:hypothetical protein DY000_02040785 [Brassica cretica]
MGMRHEAGMGSKSAKFLEHIKIPVSQDVESRNVWRLDHYTRFQLKPPGPGPPHKLENNLLGDICVGSLFSISEVFHFPKEGVVPRTRLRVLPSGDPERSLTGTRGVFWRRPEYILIVPAIPEGIVAPDTPRSFPLLAQFRHRTRAITCALKSNRVAHFQQASLRQDIAPVILLSWFLSGRIHTLNPGEDWFPNNRPGSGGWYETLSEVPDASKDTRVDSSFGGLYLFTKLPFLRRISLSLQGPSDVPQSMDQSKESDQHEDQNVPDIPIEVHSSDRTRQTDRAMHRIDPRMSGLELRPDPRPDERTDRTEARLSRTTQQAKADARLARTACANDCADDLASLFDPIMDFSFGYSSKERILKLSEDLGHAETQLFRSERPAAFAERPAALADRPAHVLILSALDTASSDESGQKPNGHLDYHIQVNTSSNRWTCESYQATTRDPALGGLVSHIKHHLESEISILSALDTASSDESGQEPNGHLD